MKKNVIVYGLISGVAIAVWTVISIGYCYSSGSFEGSMVLGYGAMLLAFSLIFVAVKNYRDKYNGGVISFGSAFKMGLYIALITSTIYVLAWMVDYYVFIPDFMDKYTAHIISKAQSTGAGAAEIAAKTEEINKWKEMYKTPIGVALATYMEILPVGLTVAVITALILKRKADSSTIPSTESVA